jgi:hypothetical protein
MAVNSGHGAVSRCITGLRPKPGDVTGDGFNKVWHAVDPAAGLQLRSMNGREQPLLK